MHQILIVDDDPKYLDVLEQMILKSAQQQKKQWGIHLSGSVDQALSVIQNQQIDLIVCDVVMPQKTGWDLLAELKADSQTQNTPVIMITGNSDEKLRLKALENNADILFKPFDIIELFTKIINSLKIKDYQDTILKQNLVLEQEVADRAALFRLTTDISTSLVEENDLKDLLRSCCQSIVDHLSAAFARVWIFDRDKQQLELVASAGMYTHTKGKHQYLTLDQGSKISYIAKTREPHLTNAVIGDPQVLNQTWAKKENLVAFAGHPLVAKGQLVGVLAMFSRNILKDSALEAIASVSYGIALGIIQKQADDKVHFYSFYDSLTQLPNRRFFYVFLGRMIHYANQNLKHFALLLIDIDHFGRINENLGHMAGDKCLKIISQRLLTTLQNSGNLPRLSDEKPPVARMGGDEFAVLLQDVSDVNHINQLVHSVLNELSEVMMIADRKVALTASIGISTYPEDANSIIDLFKNAQTALNHAKSKKQGDVIFYSQTMNEGALEILDLEINLRQALKNNEFVLYYQPKIETHSKTVVGAEALIRWITKDGKFIPPGRFIPLAEETGMILDIGDWVVKEVCRQNKVWADRNIAKLPVAINISGKQLGQDDFVERVLGFAKDSGLPLELLELEITETAIMMNPEEAVEGLIKLKEHGIKIALDDFGTGYSSLAYLQSLPIDVLKIDLSFIRNILTNPNDAVMVKAIISMAHNLGLKVVAEGVEDEMQLKHLADLKCDVIQGYYFSRPLPAKEFETFLTKN